MMQVAQGRMFYNANGRRIPVRARAFGEYLIWAPRTTFAGQLRELMRVLWSDCACAAEPSAQLFCAQSLRLCVRAYQAGLIDCRIFPIVLEQNLALPCTLSHKQAILFLFINLASLVQDDDNCSPCTKLSIRLESEVMRSQSASWRPPHAASSSSSIVWQFRVTERKPG